MPYKDKAAQSKFQVDWVRKRRQEWVNSHGPCLQCKSTKDLRVVKKNDSTQHVKVFGWSDELRKKVLKNCMVLCSPCMVKHYAALMKKERTQCRGESRLLNAEVVWAIRGRLLGRESMRQIGEYYKIGHKQVSQIRDGKLWGWLKPSKRQVHGVNKQ